MPEVKGLPKIVRSGGTLLHRHWSTGEPPQPDGVRRVNNRAVELETFANLQYSGNASAIGLSILTVLLALPFIFYIYGEERLTLSAVAEILLISSVLPGLAAMFYFLGGTHHTRGAYIRIHRGTRKLYFVYPRQTRLHILDWDQLEILAARIRIRTQTGQITQHPLCFIGIDYTMDPPSEICAACGNLGVFDGSRSAKSLFSYLQAFMQYGPEGLPKPPPVPPRLSRLQEALRPYRDWYADVRSTLTEPYGLLQAPITIPLWLWFLLIKTFPESLENFIQYNVPYTQFPKEIDKLCGFHEKRKPVIRVNGKRIDS